MKIIGITGGIGSGKSVASKIIQKAGIPILYSDPIAKEVMDSDEEIKRDLIIEFGEEVYVNGKINKEFLSGLIFSNKENMHILNTIVHPKVISSLEEKIHKEFEKEEIVCVESALIFESKIEAMFNYILTITAPEEMRIRRVLDREETTYGEIKQRIDSQFPEETKTSLADFVIQNDDTIEKLENNVLFFLNLIRKI
jgi:dephospho-CoA kinase